ncbi:coumaroyl-CoA:anthocyanidin 3-O-glucoside-6''-O-coumaroyltransferase 1-like [Gastrolobium bilobum]|uniref:coumaroyl-CoA:anthocyanidin 3-O-glucoside-6''-O-coumaroyltransferase 1-like n=1 Tax=Gastrolobium bilobum TaxID=150636 RepID=UPI002AB1107E|nr:coumaroyl-CoA:anthocyanidin 3-O-glucoside-6''-O-coumaroyltransferase 1-like [Gastrolobium bilobum]
MVHNKFDLLTLHHHHHKAQLDSVSLFHKLLFVSSFQNQSTKMAQEINGDAVMVIESCRVAPPPGSVPSTTLPLTFFDIPWFYTKPVQRIFFYEFPYPKHHFLQKALPNLKHSLSLTLQHFFPFVSNLIVPPNLNVPFIRYLDGDSLLFTVAESTADFTLLVSDSPQDVRYWHPLVPTLPSPEDGTRVIPLMAIQVTILPNSGFSICLTFNHVACDGKSLHHFMKYWASLCKARVDLASIEASLSLPSNDRDKVKDPKGLKLIYLRELQDLAKEFSGFKRDVFTNKVRATLVLSRERVEKLKKWVSLKCTSYSSGTLHISTFVVTCSLIWVCMIKSEQNKGDCVAKDSDKLCYLVFVADCRDLPEFSLPSTYFGNCLATCIVAIKRSEIMGQNGIVDVANVIERKVRDLKSDALRNAETLMSDFRELGKPDQSFLVIAGSPKLAVYQTDFGWGKPKRSEAVHVDSSPSISLSDCRDKEGGIEVGVGLERIRMNNFINILEEQLNNIISL